MNRPQESLQRRRKTLLILRYLIYKLYMSSYYRTNIAQAVRILKLLEDHHQKLAQIIKSKDVITKKTTQDKTVTAAEEDAPPKITEKADLETAPTPQPAPTSTSPTAHRGSAPSMTAINQRARDSSPALAKDIASRRGIPQGPSRKLQTVSPILSSQQAGGSIRSTAPRHLSPESRARRPAQHPPPDVTKTMATSTTTAASSSVRSRRDPQTTTATDDGFTKFYTDLTTGAYGKLTSMLAFAGLPLVDTPTSPTSASVSSLSTSSHLAKPHPRTRATADADISKYVSRAALAAIESQHRARGFNSPAFGAESFYVIPTSGGTVSYADMVRDARRAAAGADGDSGNDTANAKGDDVGNGDGNAKTKPQIANSVREEELALENATLKSVLDALSHRLAAFESHAQDASMHQSLVSVSSRAAHAGGSTNVDRDIEALTLQLRKEAKERDRLRAENEKQKAVIGRYRAHWETLKEGARGKMARRVSERAGEDAGANGEGSGKGRE